jgi:hypothetical protein
VIAFINEYRGGFACKPMIAECNASSLIRRPAETVGSVCIVALR